MVWLPWLPVNITLRLRKHGQVSFSFGCFTYASKALTSLLGHMAQILALGI